MENNDLVIGSEYYSIFILNDNFKTNSEVFFLRLQISLSAK